MIRKYFLKNLKVYQKFTAHSSFYLRPRSSLALGLRETGVTSAVSITFVERMNVGRNGSTHWLLVNY